MQVRPSEPEFPRPAGTSISAPGFPALSAVSRSFLCPCWVCAEPVSSVAEGLACQLSISTVMLRNKHSQTQRLGAVDVCLLISVWAHGGQGLRGCLPAPAVSGGPSLG